MQKRNDIAVITADVSFELTRQMLQRQIHTQIRLNSYRRDIHILTEQDYLVTLHNIALKTRKRVRDSRNNVPERPFGEAPRSAKWCS
jgi:hypothetical protein